MKLKEVIAYPTFDFRLEEADWFAVIGPGKRVMHLCCDFNAAEVLRMREGPATHEVRKVRYDTSDD